MSASSVCCRLWPTYVQTTMLAELEEEQEEEAQEAIARKDYDLLNQIVRDFVFPVFVLVSASLCLYARY